MSNNGDIFTPADIDEIAFAFNTQFRISWYNIINCIKHEMYPKIGSAIRPIIYNGEIKQQDSDSDDDEIASKVDLYDLSKTQEVKVIQYLKTKRKLPIEERNYLSNLIQRARSFIPITTQNRGMH